MFLKHCQLLGSKVVDISMDINIPAQEVPHLFGYFWSNITGHQINLCALSGTTIDSNILELNRR